LEVNHKQIPLSQASHFPKLFIDYIEKNTALNEFYDSYPDLKGFEKTLSNRKFTHRKTLVNALNQQYKDIENPPNIDLLLEENTFTVTTGHQLNIFTGPLYVIYKIVSTINLARKLKSAFPNYNFVPVYWMATEDHDFEEISSFNLFGQKHKWETEQKGGVGRMNPKELQTIIENLREKPEIFAKAYGNSTLAAAVRQYMHELFGSQGLVCLDGDDASLKSIFAPVMRQDIIENKAEQIVAETSARLENLGYKTQIHARNINFFYLDENLRERIEKNGETYTVVNTNLSFSENNILEIIDKNPEKISPNVVLRPIYQETILPNIAYLGGPSEVSYWLQLKDIFEHHEVPFPILLPRNLALVVNDASKKRMEKLNVSPEELFQDDNSLKKSFVEKNSENTLSLADEIEQIGAAFDQIIKKASEVDPTLKPAMESEKVKNATSLEHLEKRIKKAEEKKFETSLAQLQTLKEKLFPGGGLQERSDNFLNFYLNDSAFLGKISQHFDPLDFKFNIIFV
jgi:bacillithiol synthase